VVVRGTYTAGLAAKQGIEYAKGSIDFVLTVEEQGVLKTWGFEAKGRVTATTAANEERNLIQILNPQERICDSDVFSSVGEVGERFQILQHAFVYDFSTVVLAISESTSELIRSLTDDFSNDLKNHFANVLSWM